MSVIIKQQDNLELLLSQLDESVDLIYCDILYGTGKDFMDYKDLYPMREIIEEHYLPRLQEMHRVLKSTGSIYLQMDYRIVHWVRCLMDDIFSYGNFRNQIVWKRGTVKGAKAVGNQFARNHDTILYYTRSNNYKYNRQFIPYTKEYIKERFTADDNDGRGSYANQAVGTLSEDSIKKLKDDNRIFLTSGNKLRIKYYLNESKGIAMDDAWVDIYEINSMAKDNTKYPTQKPKVLIERIIKASSNEGDTVADYYLGSGTTAVVCKELNRNFIGCDINKKAIEITQKRLCQ